MSFSTNNQNHKLSNFNSTNKILNNTNKSSYQYCNTNNQNDTKFLKESYYYQQNYQNQFQNSGEMNSLYKCKYPNSDFDFEKKMDYLLVSNAQTKLRNQNKSYEDLEKTVINLEMSNIKNNNKLEKIKYELVKSNQIILDLNSTIKEKDIEYKFLYNRITSLESEKTYLIKNFEDKFNTKNTLEENNDYLIEDKYLTNTNSKEKENFIENNSSDFEDMKNAKQMKMNKLKEEVNDTKNIESLNDISDSSLLEGFENNESLLASIKNRDNSINKIINKKITWEDLINSNKIQRNDILMKLNIFDTINYQNKNLKEEIKNLKKFEYMNYQLEKELKNFNKKINEKEEEINNLKEEMKNLKNENIQLITGDFKEENNIHSDNNIKKDFVDLSKKNNKFIEEKKTNIKRNLSKRFNENEFNFDNDNDNNEKFKENNLILSNSSDNDNGEKLIKKRSDQISKYSLSFNKNE